MNPKDCDKKKFKTPVSWLMGRELLAGLKWIAGYTFMGDKQDAKDWMCTEVIHAPHSNNNSSEPYWFDYIADTGDGMSAVYNIAYLCMSDLWLEKQPHIGPDAVAIAEGSGFSNKLPRGEFLFIGGDTAYHIADSASLKERFQMPFNCACLDIMRTGKAVDQRPLYGIPANHDYYDALDGFNRQFCKPVGGDDSYNPMLDDPKFPQLGLLGFERTQTASYVAIDLPFGWKLWGLDSQTGKMDKRQQAFFVSTFAQELLKTGALFDKVNQETVCQQLLTQSPKKLIVATPEPTTVFGKWAKVNKTAQNDEEDGIINTFKKLGLELSFTQDKSGQLSQGKCRLDISGDIHHYERYWGSETDNSTPVNYASIVAGGGGAFLHPSHTDVGEVMKQRVYPSRPDSHKLVTQKILKPWNIFLGGFIWLAGGVIAFLNYFAVTIPESTWSLFKLIPDELRPPLPTRLADNLLSDIRQNLYIASPPGFCTSDYCFDLFYLLAYIIMLGIWVWRWKRSSRPDGIVNLSGAAWLKTVVQYTLAAVPGVLLLMIFTFVDRPEEPNPFLAGLLIDLFVIIAGLLFTLNRIYSDILIDRARYQRENVLELTPLWLFGVLGVLYAAFGFLRNGIYSSSIMTFDLLTAIIWLLSTLGLVGVAVMAGGHLFDLRGKITFGVIGIWHTFLQVTIPVALVLYNSWEQMLTLALLTLVATLAAAYLFTNDKLVKEFSLADQKKLATIISIAWVVLGAAVFFAASWGEPVAATWPRLYASFFLGAFFSCIWFGWYLAVSLAFHGHNNEAGGGARSEQYRHLIRFKLEENQLTGYVIGIDTPVNDFTIKPAPKFRLVDVFKISIE